MDWSLFSAGLDIAIVLLCLMIWFRLRIVKKILWIIEPLRQLREEQAKPLKVERGEPVGVVKKTERGLVLQRLEETMPSPLLNDDEIQFIVDQVRSETMEKEVKKPEKRKKPTIRRAEVVKEEDDLGEEPKVQIDIPSMGG